jgi:hypothetical protein
MAGAIGAAFGAGVVVAGFADIFELTPVFKSNELLT